MRSLCLQEKAKPGRPRPSRRAVAASPHRRHHSAVVDELKSLGSSLLSSRHGSHGGATAEGSGLFWHTMGSPKRPWRARSSEHGSGGDWQDEGHHGLLRQERVGGRPHCGGRMDQCAPGFFRGDRERPVQDDGHRLGSSRGRSIPPCRPAVQLRGDLSAGGTDRPGHRPCALWTGILQNGYGRRPE